MLAASRNLQACALESAICSVGEARRDGAHHGGRDGDRLTGQADFVEQEEGHPVDRAHTADHALRADEDRLDAIAIGSLEGAAENAAEREEHAIGGGPVVEPVATLERNDLSGVEQLCERARRDLREDRVGARSGFVDAARAGGLIVLRSPYRHRNPAVLEFARRRARASYRYPDARVARTSRSERDSLGQLRAPALEMRRRSF